MQAVADANPESALARLLPQFKRWYSQAGTPRLAASGFYDAEAKTYRIEFSQTCPATPGQNQKEPFVIPISLGLVGNSGTALPLHIKGKPVLSGDRHLFVMTHALSLIHI